MQEETPVHAPYEAPLVEDLPTDGPSSVCAMIVPISQTE
jgi:hypothetical protein